MPPPHRTAQRRHHPLERLIDAIDPRLRSDAYWPQLAAHLAQATPPHRTCARSSHRRPPAPPTNYPQRRCGGASPARSPTATLATTRRGYAQPGSPTSTQCSDQSAETITSDPCLARIGRRHQRRRPHKWTPRDLLGVAAEHLADASADSDPSRPAITPD
jgi:hypothetical protein